mgnify:CR=1 FL=1
MVRALYKAPKFVVRIEDSISNWYVQGSGIRQGCPLSPYLFVLVMTCIEADAVAKLSGRTTTSRLPNLDYDMVFYADDTRVFSNPLQGIDEILGHIETTSSEYGLSLNKDKCVIYPG